jgi:hypothetical protein
MQRDCGLVLVRILATAVISNRCSYGLYHVLCHARLLVIASGMRTRRLHSDQRYILFTIRSKVYVNNIVRTAQECS